MIKLAFTEKGGIGKSTAASNVSIALAQKGLKVMQIGCDPKGRLHHISPWGREGYPPFLTLCERRKRAEDMVRVGYNGVVCVEAGGPVPGAWCNTGKCNRRFGSLKKGAYRKYQPDVVITAKTSATVCAVFDLMRNCR